jgi:uncharacterized protein YsxB (DUF464 family)
MIRIEAALDREGILVSYRAKGHAGAGPKGFDIVCAAVSVLSRTLVRVLHGKGGIEFTSKAPEKGLFELTMNYTDEGKEFLRTAGFFLLEGLQSIADEYPMHCNIDITSLKER